MNKKMAMIALVDDDRNILTSVGMALEAEGYAGHSKVKIFSSNNWWQKDSGEVMDTCIARHKTVV